MTDGAERVRAPGAVSPRPAMVWMVVAGAGAESSGRTRWLPVSARVRSVEGERAAARGVLREAAMAGPPSPAKAWVPSPATVVMMPVVASMRRMRGFWGSAGYRLPAGAVGVTGGGG